MNARIISAQDFDDSPRGHAERLAVEFSSACKHVERWHEQGEKIWKRFVDERANNSKEFRLNLFHADTEMKHAMLFGKAPKPEVARRFADPQDDTARVGGEMMERILGSDIEKDSDTTVEALDNALLDWLVPGLGIARLRYEADFETVEVEAQLNEIGEVIADGYTEERKTREDVTVDYVHWKDFLWSPARTWNEVRMLWFKAHMTREAMVERFGEVGKSVPLNHKNKTRRGGDDDPESVDPWGRAEVWEIWDKERKKVFWWVKGFDRILDEKDDTLELEGFFPCPRPLIANRTTQKLIPTPDFSIAQDLYDGIDVLYARICLLEQAVRVAGVYNGESDEIKNLLRHTNENKLYPVDAWAMFAEKGGLKGQVDWLPLEIIAAAIDKLTQKLNDKIALVQQVSGMADVMRGAAIQSTTATEAKVKANFGSIRMQQKQDEFARFATDIHKLKSEIIAKHFDPETIIARSNIEYTADAPLAMQAVEFLKNKLQSCYRIEVKSDQIAMQDRASLTQERTQFLQAASTFFQAAVPLAQALGGPQATPLLLELVKFPLASLRGSSGMEGIMDQAIAQATQKAQQPQPPPPPDPKIVAAQMKQQGEQMKGQVEMAKVQAELQADLTRIAAQTKANAANEQMQSFMAIQEEAAKAKIKAANGPATKPEGA